MGRGPSLPRLRRALRLLADPRTPRLPRLAVGLALAYLVSPIDLIPDWAVPVVGWLDDLTLLWLAFRWLLRSGGEAREEQPEATGGRRLHREDR